MGTATVWDLNNNFSCRQTWTTYKILGCEQTLNHCVCSWLSSQPCQDDSALEKVGCAGLHRKHELPKTNTLSSLPLSVLICFIQLQGAPPFNPEKERQRIQDKECTVLQCEMSEKQVSDAENRSEHADHDTLSTKLLFDSFLEYMRTSTPVAHKRKAHDMSDSDSDTKGWETKHVEEPSSEETSQSRKSLLQELEGLKSQKTEDLLSPAISQDLIPMLEDWWQ